MSRWQASRSAGSSSAGVVIHPLRGDPADVTSYFQWIIRQGLLSRRGPRSGGCGRREGEPPLPAGARQVDALEDGGHLGGGDLEAVACGRREAEGAALQSLRPDGQPVPVPIEDLEAVAAAIAEDE